MAKIDKQKTSCRYCGNGERFEGKSKFSEWRIDSHNCLMICETDIDRDAFGQTFLSKEYGAAIRFCPMCGRKLGAGK